MGSRMAVKICMSAYRVQVVQVFAQVECATEDLDDGEC